MSEGGAFVLYEEWLPSEKTFGVEIVKLGFKLTLCLHGRGESVGGHSLPAPLRSLVPLSLVQNGSQGGCFYVMSPGSSLGYA